MDSQALVIDARKEYHQQICDIMAPQLAGHFLKIWHEAAKKKQPLC